MLLTIFLVFAAALATALITYFLAPSPFAARVAASEAVSNQLAEQVRQKDAEVKGLRESLEGEQKQRIAAQTSLEDERRLLAEQKKTLDDAQTKLTEVFQGLAAQALVQNNKAFMDAGENFSGLRKNAVNEIGNLVQPLYNELLDTSTRRTCRPSKTHASRHTPTSEEHAHQRQPDAGPAQGRDLEPGDRPAPPERARPLGKLTLKRVAELTGMAEHCDFEEQVAAGRRQG